MFEQYRKDYSNIDDVLDKVIDKGIDYLDDIDKDILDQLDSKKSCFGFCNIGIIHQNRQSLKQALKKRVSYWNIHSNDLSVNRRYQVFDKSNIKDLFKLFYFIFSSITMIIPIFQSLKGYYYSKNIIWFIHPLICICFFLAYSIGVFKKTMRL